MEKMDLTKLTEMLAQMQEMIDGIREMLPESATSAADEETAIDEETEGQQAELDDDSMLKNGAPDDARNMKKAAIVRMMAKG